MLMAKAIHPNSLEAIDKNSKLREAKRKGRSRKAWLDRVNDRCTIEELMMYMPFTPNEPNEPKALRAIRTRRRDG